MDIDFDMEYEESPANKFMELPSLVTIDEMKKEEEENSLMNANYCKNSKYDKIGYRSYMNDETN